jgi:hypothetical protein
MKIERYGEDDDDFNEDPFSGDDESTTDLISGSGDFESDGGDSSATFSENKRSEMNTLNDDQSGEQRYCLCKDISYGDMILCDNRQVFGNFFIFLRLKPLKFNAFLMGFSVTHNGFISRVLD